ncbi:MAG: 6-phosphofructokinase, partial [Candidatus Eiseniibacteriota bacterium]
MLQESQGHEIRRVAIVFAGGPAPGANAVISSTAISFLDADREVVGFLNGYENLENYHPISNRMQLDRHYVQFQLQYVSGLRNTRGVMIGTSRANPGKAIGCQADLDDPQKTAKLRNIYTALVDLGIDALVSIGGDD